jgi:hypothetical protein
VGCCKQQVAGFQNPTKPTEKSDLAQDNPETSRRRESDHENVEEHARPPMKKKRVIEAKVKSKAKRYKSKNKWTQRKALEAKARLTKAGNGENKGDQSMTPATEAKEKLLAKDDENSGCPRTSRVEEVNDLMQTKIPSKKKMKKKRKGRKVGGLKKKKKGRKQKGKKKKANM